MTPDMPGVSALTSNSPPPHRPVPAAERSDAPDPRDTAQLGTCATAEKSPQDSPTERRLRHLQMFEAAAMAAPPAMARLLSAVHGEVDDLARRLEAVGESADRRGMFAARVAQYLPAFILPPQQPSPLGTDHRAPQLLAEVSSTAGQQVAQELKRHSMGFLEADREVRLQAPAPAATAPSAADVDALIDQDAGPQERESIHRDLDPLPPAMIRLAMERGLRILVVPRDMKEVPARLFTEDVDPRAMIRQWDAYHASVAERQRAVQELQQDAAFQDTLRRISSQMPLVDPLHRPADLTEEVRKEGNLRHQLDDAWQQALSQHGIRLSNLPPPPTLTMMVAEADAPPPETPAAAVSNASFPALPGEKITPPKVIGAAPAAATLRPGQNMRDIARGHGAQSEAAVAEFLDLAARQNEGAFDPSRPLEVGDVVNVPDLYYYQGKRFSSAAYAHILTANADLPKDGKELGNYDPGANLLMVDSQVLPDPNPLSGRKRVLLHEFEHVLRALAPAAEDDNYAERVQKMAGVSQLIRQDAVQRFGPNPTLEQLRAVELEYLPSAPVVTLYSLKSADEHDAEGFMTFHQAQLTQEGAAAGTDATRDMLKLRDPELFLRLARQQQTFQ